MLLEVVRTMYCTCCTKQITNDLVLVQVKQTTSMVKGWHTCLVCWRSRVYNPCRPNLTHRCKS